MSAMKLDSVGSAGGVSAAKAAVVVSPAVKGAAGSLGGLVEACCLQPIDVIKTRLQLDKATPPRYAGIIDCGSKIYTQEGVAALWKGLVPFSTHLTLKYALRMSTNAGFQSLLRDKETGQLTQGKRLLAGFGTLFSIVLHLYLPLLFLLPHVFFRISRIVHAT